MVLPVEGYVERAKLSELELLDRARGAPVAVDHLARGVARAVGHPGLALAVREGERDEGSSQIVDTELSTILAVGVELGAIDAG